MTSEDRAGPANEESVLTSRPLDCWESGLARPMVTQVDSGLVILGPGNRPGSDTYQAVWRGTKFGT